MLRKRVLIAHPYVHPSGGGNAVAAWAIEALCKEFDVTLATLGPVDCSAVNRSFGTSLRAGEFAVEVAPRSYQIALRALPTPGALLQVCCTMRWAQELDSRAHFDVLLGTQNELDFGRPGLQYVHYPWVFLPRPKGEYRWYHRIPGLLTAYRGICQSVAHISNEGMRRNLSLANSGFVADRIRQVHGTGSVILHPPVPGEFPNIPWESRRTAAVAVGRMHGVKRWEMAVAIVDQVRRRGVDFGLTLISHADDPGYGKRIAALAESRPWFRILSNVTRAQLVEEIAHHRYGIHTMEDEHFGIAVAEILRAGAIPFVHNSGGPVEIVGGRPELCFNSVREAAGKIAAVLASPPLQQELHQFAQNRRDCFSAENFCRGLRNLVGNFEEYRLAS
ncbi:MAG TPA: glycosyltransferase [Bryobacteraceae bacterium]|nr:glycosyltransferase [Bryobacteraceae bacterium]